MRLRRRQAAWCLWRPWRWPAAWPGSGPSPSTRMRPRNRRPAEEAEGRPGRSQDVAAGGGGEPRRGGRRGAAAAVARRPARRGRLRALLPRRRGGVGAGAGRSDAHRAQSRQPRHRRRAGPYRSRRQPLPSGRLAAVHQGERFQLSDRRRDPVGGGAAPEAQGRGADLARRRRHRSAAARRSRHDLCHAARSASRGCWPSSAPTGSPPRRRRRSSPAARRWSPPTSPWAGPARRAPPASISSPSTRTGDSEERYDAVVVAARTGAAGSPAIKSPSVANLEQSEPLAQGQWAEVTFPDRGGRSVCWVKVLALDPDLENGAALHLRHLSPAGLPGGLRQGPGGEQPRLARAAGRPAAGRHLEWASRDRRRHLDRAGGALRRLLRRRDAGGGGARRLGPDAGLHPGDRRGGPRAAAHRPAPGRVVRRPARRAGARPAQGVAGGGPRAAPADGGGRPGPHHRGGGERSRHGAGAHDDRSQRPAARARLAGLAGRRQGRSRRRGGRAGGAGGGGGSGWCRGCRGHRRLCHWRRRDGPSLPGAAGGWGGGRYGWRGRCGRRGWCGRRGRCGRRWRR